jgi:hypothetical protein
MPQAEPTHKSIVNNTLESIFKEKAIKQKMAKVCHSFRGETGNICQTQWKERELKGVRW